VLKLDSIIPKAGEPPEATALNSPTIKSTVGIDARDLPYGSFGGLTMRFVKDYQFLSGSHNGRIPGFITSDISVGRKLNSWSSMNVTVQNLFTCTSGTVVPPRAVTATRPSTYVRGWGCGIGREHGELLNMPSVGTMMFFGLRIDR
jgi:hypothetical protein